jgi:hypothetical protein
LRPRVLENSVAMMVYAVVQIQNESSLSRVPTRWSEKEKRDGLLDMWKDVDAWATDLKYKLREVFEISDREFDKLYEKGKELRGR